jgi:ABC-type microcin C transport system permease subunit YejE
MAPISNSTGPEAGQSPWLGIAKFLLVAILIGLIFLLGEEMVRHRFFRGGWVDQHDVLKP